MSAIVPRCAMCDGRGVKDYAGFAMEPCECRTAPPWPYEDRPQFHDEDIKIFRGRQWVPLELAESKLQFWQRREWAFAWQQSEIEQGIRALAQKLPAATRGRDAPHG